MKCFVNCSDLLLNSHMKELRDFTSPMSREIVYENCVAVIFDPSDNRTLALRNG